MKRKDGKHFSKSTFFSSSLCDFAALRENHFLEFHSTTSCRLRDAIAKAVAGDTINFAVTGTIILNSGELVLSKNLSITGPGATNLTVSGNQASGVFRTSGFNTITISSLTIANGKSSIGGGINNNTANLTLNFVAIIGNKATFKESAAHPCDERHPHNHDQSGVE